MDFNTLRKNSEINLINLHANKENKQTKHDGLCNWLECCIHKRVLRLQEVEKLQKIGNNLPSI